MTNEEKVSDLLLQWEEARERGDDLEAETLCTDCPELVETLGKQIAALRQMEWMTQPSKATPDPKIGMTLAGRYRIDELVGEGGHGKVYRGFDPELQRPVAIKLPNDRRWNTSDLLEEARKIARLRYPGIVTVYDVGQHEGAPFIVSDFVSGTTLCEAGPFTPPDTAALVAEIAESLHAAHEQGFVHRDIKPANILIDEQGRPLLTDFGIATASGEAQSQMVGTLPYMAPEQVGEDTDNGDLRTDIWALGVVLYELLTSKLPFNNPSPAKLCDQIKTHVPIPPRGINSGIPPALEAIVLKCLAKAPEERYETAAQLAHELRTYRHRRSMLRWGLLSLALLIPIVLLTIGVRDGCFSDSRSPSQAATSVQGMVFDGHTRVVTPLTSFAPCTLEAWIAPSGHESVQFVIGSDVPSAFGIGVGITGNHPNVETIRGGFWVEDTVIPPKSWTHLATVHGAEETRLYVNGKLVGTGAATQQPTKSTPFVIGNVGEQHKMMFFQGRVRSTRISRGERYRADFQPEAHFAPDESAVLLYDFEQANGHHIQDLSGYGLHGRVERVEQVKVSPHQPHPRRVLRFEGGAVIETPVKPFLPCTLEAWVLPKTADGIRHIIGSHSMSLTLRGFDLAPEGFAGHETVDPEVEAGRWTHVAGVFTKDGTLLFVDGRKVWNAAACTPNPEERFLVGGGSTTNTSEQFFGQIRCVRISRGARFLETFTPDYEFDPDDETVLIYKGENVDGLKVIDASGSGNDGRWVPVRQ